MDSEENMTCIASKMHPSTKKGAGKQLEFALFHFLFTLFFPRQLYVLLLYISSLLIAYHKISVSEFTSITPKLFTQTGQKRTKRSVMKVVRE